MTRSAPLLLAVLAATLAGPAAAPAGAKINGAERAIVRQVNDVRSDHGLGRLRASPPLGRAADAHSRDMIANDFFDHTSSDGTPFDRRVRRYVQASSLGETLAMLGQRRGGAAMVVRMWMDSPPHRAVLLDSGFRRIGLARRWGDVAGAGRSVVTADFASRR